MDILMILSTHHHSLRNGSVWKSNSAGLSLPIAFGVSVLLKEEEEYQEKNTI